jgi:hypothetical protein
MVNLKEMQYNNINYKSKVLTNYKPVVKLKYRYK